MSKSEKKRRDVQMAAANDKDGQETQPVKAVQVVTGLMEDLKKNRKKQKNIVETDERRTVAVRYEFTAPEIAKIAQDMAQRQIELVEVEDEKKSVMASFTDRIKAKKVDIAKFSRQVRDGWENRDHQTTLIFDFKKRQKRYKDVETKKIVKVEAFGPGDEQRRFL